MFVGKAHNGQCLFITGQLIAHDLEIKRTSDEKKDSVKGLDGRKVTNC